MNIQLPSKILKAVAKFASKDDNRYMLKSLVVSSDGNNHTIYATDGRRAIVVSVKGDQAAAEHDMQTCIVPLETVTRQKTQLTSLSMTGDGDVWQLGPELFKQPVGKYPSIDSAFPSGDLFQGMPDAINPSFLVDASEAAKLLGSSSVSFSRTSNDGTGACIVDFQFPPKRKDIEAVAIIMSLRADDTPSKPLRERFKSSIIEVSSPTPTSK